MYKKNLKMPKGQSESVNRRTDNAMAKSKRRNNDLQTLPIKLKIQQHEPPKSFSFNQVYSIFYSTIHCSQFVKCCEENNIAMKENLRMSRDVFLRMNGIKSFQITKMLNQVRLLHLGKFFLFLLLDFQCLTPLSAIFQLYHGDQFQWWKKPEYPERTTDHGQAIGRLYNFQLRVECTLFVIYKAEKIQVLDIMNVQFKQ